MSKRMPRCLSCSTRVARLIAATALLMGAGGCESKAGNGALIGGAGGAAIGGLIGSNSHQRAGEGALIGGAVGAIGGGLIGHSMDEQDRQNSYTRDYDKNFDEYGHRRK